MTRATYSTLSTSPTIYFTAINPDGSTLASRTTTGVAQLYGGSTVYYVDVAGNVAFVARWDEGDATDYSEEYITPVVAGTTATVNVKRIFDGRYQDVSANVPIDFH